MNWMVASHLYFTETAMGKNVGAQNNNDAEYVRAVSR